MQREPSNLVPAAVAVVAGILAWDLVRLIGDRREAWDDPTYWFIGVPLMLIAAFILGLGYPERPWRWAVTIVAAQALWAMLLAFAADGVPNLLPAGLVIFLLIALVCTAAAYAGRWFRRYVA
jgi:hypothetical protein